jgi:hypothetical protein
MIWGISFDLPPTSALLVLNQSNIQFRLPAPPLPNRVLQTHNLSFWAMPRKSDQPSISYEGSAGAVSSETNGFRGDGG